MLAAGKAKYDSKKHALVWKVKRFNGATEHSLMASVELIATTRDKRAWSRPPISMNFQVCISAMYDVYFSHTNICSIFQIKMPSLSGVSCSA